MEAWLTRLAAGDGEGAWTLFDRQYRRLILATIGRLVSGADDVAEAWGGVRAALVADDFARLRRFSQDRQGAAVTSWLVVVVRNLTVDWLRRDRGRRPVAVPADLSGADRDVWIALCLEGLTPAAAFERVQTRTGAVTGFPVFLRTIRLLRRSHPCPEARPARANRTEPVPLDFPIPVTDPGEAADLAARLAAMLAALPPDLRLAVQLYVIDELAAEDVAHTVGWPNAKAVYNRVGRALQAMRAELTRAGITSGDL